MPIYEYRCESCGHELEALQKISDDALVVCPDCGQTALKKLLSAGGFRLKGSGWYETDFKRGGKKNLHGETEKGKKADSPKSQDSGKKQDSGKVKASNSASSGAGGSPS